MTDIRRQRLTIERTQKAWQCCNLYPFRHSKVYMFLIEIADSSTKSKDFGDFRDLRDFRDIRNLKDFKDFQDLRDF